MISESNHISICICTYKRPELLKRLLEKLEIQKIQNLFTYSIVVVDNDYRKSAEVNVNIFKSCSSIKVEYYVEAEQNISLARNKAIENSSGHFLAFIDDDEFPEDDWLFNHFNALKKFEADGSLGPVKPYFEMIPPDWVKKGKFFNRQSFKTGTRLTKSLYTRTGNVLLKKDLFTDNNNLFNPTYGKSGGEDVDFFKRMLQKGHLFIWCDEAIVYENIPQNRVERKYLLRSALLRGYVNSKNSSLNIINILKSIIAFLSYTLMLPFLLIIRHQYFMKFLIKDCDHIGKLLGICGIKIVSERKTL